LVIDAAEKAAAAGDFRTAELFLRDAAARQEERLGPFHPDIANTLNNLAVVYETLEQPSKAERCYRRAYAIALAALEPDHPFVAISEKNYRDFCIARGIPFEPPQALSPVEAARSQSINFVETLGSEEPLPSEPSLESVGAQEPVSSLEPVGSQEPLSSAEPVGSREPVGSPISSPERPRSLPTALIALGVLVLVGGVFWFRANDAGEPRPVSSVAAGAPEGAPEELLEPAAATRRADPNPVVESPQAADKPAPVIAPPVQSTATERPTESAGNRRAPVPPPRALKPPSAGTASARPTVEGATLCRELRNWRCTEAGDSIDSGVVFFYTRIKSLSPLTIEHRWYRNDKLERTVPLRIQPNDRNGFRTFSRTPVKSGDWRVELRVRDGAVLYTEQFSVR
jgi:hypothetical protein